MEIYITSNNLADYFINKNAGYKFSNTYNDRN